MTFKTYIYDFCSYKEENMEALNYIGLHLLNINCGNKTVMCVCVWGGRATAFRIMLKKNCTVGKQPDFTKTNTLTFTKHNIEADITLIEKITSKIILERKHISVVFTKLVSL